MAVEGQDCCQLSDMLWVQPSLKGLFNMSSLTNLFSQSDTPKPTIPTTATESQPSQSPQLPPELIRMILLHLHDTSPLDFLSALQVSQTWNSLGTTLLWRDVTLTRPQFGRFLQTIRLNPDAARQTMSLTIHPEKSLDTSPRASKLPWSELADITRSLPNLRSLTFDLRRTNTSTPCPQVIAYTSLNNILQSLPPSLTSLEIDLTGVTILRQGDTADIHPCETLRTILPRMEHLRLGNGIWCEHMFANLTETCPRLARITINTSRRQFQHVCKRVDPSTWRSGYIGDALAAEGRRAIERGCMPVLEVFDVVTTVHQDLNQQPVGAVGGGWSVGHGQGHRRNRSSLDLTDVLQDRRLSYPMCQRGSGRGEETWSLELAGQRQSGEVEEVVGSYDELSVLVEKVGHA